MAKFLVHIDMDKTFEIYFNNKSEVEEFDIWEYAPFINYLNLFDDSYGYSVSASKQSGFFGSQTHYYTVNVFKIK